ncbi:hypothetical protein K439DRAFT_1412963 [Ramaria rubella]|nr:hypothetical protein K439DRAFT_1412963 [Ramaria rubella]
MNDRLPASLVYLLIYNPTLLPPQSTARDDEDAQEEAHILFYTSRERIASRDRMLRQVGLAKALVNFSKIFSPGQGCDSIHSQGKRMVSISPEPDFWMHACVDLAKTPKETKNNNKAAKSDHHPPTTFYYHEDSVHDVVIRDYLFRGYEDFKLLHGTYYSLSKDSESGGLEIKLERFFTPWAWRWDFETINDLGVHLGLPVHAPIPSISPLITSFIGDLPSNTIPLLLSPPCIIETSKASTSPFPPSLPRYLLSLLPSPGQPPWYRNKSKESNGARLNTRLDNAHISASNNTFGFFSAAGAGMGDVMNVKKWNWPEALTFGKIGANSQNKRPQDSDAGRHGVQTTLPHTSPEERSGLSISKGHCDDAHVTTANGDIDQFALDDAISSLTPRLQAKANDGASNKTTCLSEPPEDTTLSPMISQLNHTLPIPLNDTGSLLPTSFEPPAPDFLILKVFLPEPLSPLVVRRRQVLHISLFGLVLGLIMDSDWVSNEVEAPLGLLARKVSTFLEKVREAIDKDMTQSISTPANLGTLGRSKHIISLPNHIISLDADFSTALPLFFESQESLVRDPGILEIFSRSTKPQQWFVIKRGLGFNKAGNEVRGDAYLQTNIKEASLVDADNELLGVVRRWAHGED